MFSSAQKKYPSLLWEISGNGLEESSYLYGTMHVSSRIAFSLSDSFFVALNDVDMVALESDPSEWMDEMEEADMFSRNYDWDNAHNSSGDFYSTAFSVDIPDNKDYAEMLRFEPSIVNGLLYRFNGTEADFEEDTYLDLFIFQAGKKLKKEVINLEDFKKVQALSEKAAVEAQKEKSRPSPFGYDENPYEMIQDAYRNGDLNSLDSIMLLLNSESYIQYMLFDRNAQMSNKMDSIISSGTSLFTGIGAAHLGGKKGVIEMLREKGYTLRPIIKEFSDKSIKNRSKIDELSVSLKYTYQYPTDSIFRLKIPGKLYELPMSAGKQTYIHPEMIHGSNYSVVRIKTFNAITGKQPKDIISAIDSLLFENIPGEIVKKKAINKNGNPGYDILNKTRRGDYQRYQIVALPNELIFFKLKGSRKFAKSKEANKFFESIEFLNPENSLWREFSTSSNEFKVLLPSEVTENAAISSDGFVNLQVADPINGDFYIIQRNVFHDFKYIEEDNFELKYLIESLAQESNLKLDTVHTLESDGYPIARGIISSTTGKKIYVRTTLKGGRYYMLLQVSNSGQENKDFFDSFSLQNESYPEFKTYTDTTLNFSVSTIEVPENFGEIDVYDYYQDQGEELDNSHLPVSESRTFDNEATGERMVLDYYKYHKYRSEENEQEFWKKRLNSSWNYDRLIRSEVDSGYIGKYPYREFSYTDTNSVREIHIRVILKNASKYSIYYLSDTLSEPSDFVKTFLKSFTLPETFNVPSFFENKADIFFTNIWSGDSAQVRQALSSISEVKFDSENVPRLIEFVETFKHDDFTLLEKAFLIEELGYLEHKQILPYLKKKYNQVEDTSTYQLGILKALGHQQTKEATELFKELLILETPLSKIRDINPIFFEFKDSLGLAQHLFPEILEISAIDEYQEAIYQLTARLKDEGLIQPEDYALKLKEIKWEARNAIKRKLADEEDTSDDGYNNYLSPDRTFGSYYYKPNEYNRRFYNDPLSVYSSLLDPYKDDPRVVSFFEKQNKLNDENQLLALKSMEIALGKELSDSLIDILCKSDKTRHSLYELTKHFELKIDSNCMTQKNLAKSILFKNAESKDSVTYIDRYEVEVKDKIGYVYFFKSLNSYNQEWQISYFGLFPNDESDLNPSETLRGKKIHFRGITQEEKIKNILADFKLHGRQRADKKSSGEFNDYYLYD